MAHSDSHPPRCPDTRAAPDCAGFTLLEMSVALAVFAMVAALSTPVYLAWLESGWAQRSRTELGGLVEATISYALDHDGALPDDIRALTRAGAGPGTAPYFVTRDQPLVNGYPVDPWGTAYRYSPIGLHLAEFASAGSNRVFDGNDGDDIIATCATAPVLREQTARELDAINLAIQRYNAIKLPDQPLPNDIGDLITTLVEQKFLCGDVVDYIDDSWGQLYVPEGTPVFQVTSAGSPSEE